MSGKPDILVSRSDSGADAPEETEMSKDWKQVALALEMATAKDWKQVALAERAKVTRLRSRIRWFKAGARGGMSVMIDEVMNLSDEVHRLKAKLAKVPIKYRPR